MNYPLNMSKPANIDVANSINRVPLYYRGNKIKFFRKLRNFLEVLSSMPYLGKVISNYDFEIRQIIYQKYRILYTIKHNEIYILRILHGRMKLEHIFHFYGNLIS